MVVTIAAMRSLYSIITMLPYTHLANVPCFPGYADMNYNWYKTPNCGCYGNHGILLVGSYDLVYVWIAINIGVQPVIVQCSMVAHLRIRTLVQVLGIF